MPELITDLDTIRQLALAHRDAFAILRYQLEAMDGLDDATLDAFVEAVAMPIIAAQDDEMPGRQSIDVIRRTIGAYFSFCSIEKS